MREIKYRGKSKDTGEWVYGQTIKYGKASWFMNTTEYIDDWEEVEHLCEYVGRNDKHDREIYEGDIVKLPEDGGDKIYSIKYTPNRLGFTLSNGCGFALAYGIEVIGNVYDNPELLQ